MARPPIKIDKKANKKQIIAERKAAKEARRKEKVKRNRKVFSAVGSLIMKDGKEYGFVSERKGFTAYRNAQDHTDVIIRNKAGKFFKLQVATLNGVWSNIEERLS
jgi:pyruvoyl-dependent arginine decarboxylase (PvlArgDC)